MNLLKEIREEYELCVYSVLQEYPNKKLNTQFEISVDMIESIDGWDFEGELGEIFDSITSKQSGGDKLKNIS